eukprot:12758216-Heterocapsa_arctica.AAC.1
MDFLETSTKKEREKREIDLLKSTMETRTATMDHIMVNSELGVTCRHFDNLEDYQINKKEVCGLPAKCLMCKSFMDVKDMEKAYSDGHSVGMRQWINIMQNNVEWQNASTKTRFFMVCTQLSSSSMKQERKDVSGYGAVRMSKEETDEM